MLPLYRTMFFVLWRFRRLIWIMAVVETILNNYHFFDDIVDIPKEGIEQHRK